MTRGRVKEAFSPLYHMSKSSVESESRTRTLGLPVALATSLPHDPLPHAARTPSHIIVSPLASHRLRNASLPLRGKEGIGSTREFYLQTVFYLVV